MDIQKTIIYICLLFVGLMLWAEWQKEQAEKAVSSKVAPVVQNLRPSPSHIQEEKIENRAPEHLTKASEKSYPASTSISNQTIAVTTDLLNIKIDQIGGGIVDAILLKHYIDSDNQKHYKLFNSDPKKLYLADIGIVSDGKVMPKTRYITSANKFSLEQNKKYLTVKLTGLQNDNIAVERTYRFTRGKHSVDVATKITNNGNKSWQGKLFYQLVRKEVEASSSFMFGMGSYLGGAISDENNKLYEKIAFSDIKKQPLNREVKSGWVAMQEHYFLTSFIPPKDSTNTFYSQEFANNQYGLGYSSQEVIIQSGESHTFNSQLYIGPEYKDELEELSKGLELTIDYGWLWFISGFLFTALKFVNSYTHNWGWSIILLTVLIKLIFYKLSSTSYRSMANMKKFQPKIQALKEKYGDDKQKLNQAMMDIYKKEKINPLGGCLPLLVQIPVFIALYWVLLESVELRHSPFILWITDLSSRDPYFVLPVLMGGSMFLQQKLSPPPSDPVQAQVMMFLPVVFTLLFLSFPAGLVLYWTVNNVLSILQQWHITRTHEEKNKPKKALSNA